MNPPTAEQILAVHALMPTRYKLPLLVLDATGMRIGELEALTWGDVDEAHGRWRVSAGVSKSGTARWVQPPPELFEAVTRLVARDDRTPDRQVFMGFGGGRSRGRAPPPPSQHSRRMIFGIVVSACSTWAGCPGRGSGSWSATATSSPPRGRTRTSSRPWTSRLRLADHLIRPDSRRPRRRRASRTHIVLG